MRTLSSRISKWESRFPKRDLMRNCFLAIFMLPTLCLAADVKLIDLPAPQTDGGKPLMKALKDRHSAREFSDRVLSPQMLSNLLWAGTGPHAQALRAR
jgi:hypothetical protein